MELSEFIKLDISYHYDRELIFENYIKFLSSISESDFDYKEVLKINSFKERFIQAVSIKRFISDEEKDFYNKVVVELIEILRRRKMILSKSWLLKILSLNNKTKIGFQIEDSFEKVLYESIKLISKAKEFDHLHDNLDIGDFYNPKNSNKEKIKKLLLEAIDCLHDDTTLKEKCKKVIIDFLKKAIDELDSDYTNWTNFLGKLKEIIIVLGAMGPLVGGISVITAKDKVEEAAQVVYQTSITINHKSINETFNISDTSKLQHFQDVLKLEENSKIKQNEKKALSNNNGNKFD